MQTLYPSNKPLTCFSWYPLKVLQCLIILFSLIFAQDSKAQESELQKIHNQAVDIIKQHPDSAATLILQVIELANQQGNYEALGLAYDNLAGIYSRKKEYQQAIEYSKLSLGAYQQAKDSLQIGMLMIQVGTNYRTLGSYQKATEFLTSGIQIIERHQADATQKGIAYHNLASVYQRLGQYEESLAFYEKAIEFYAEKKDTARTIKARDNIAIIYKEQEKYALAEQILLQNLEAQKLRNNQRAILVSYINLGDLYNRKEQFQQADQMYAKILAAPKANRFFKMVAYGGRAASQKGLKAYTKAITFLDQGFEIAQAMNNPEMIKKFHESLADAHELNNSFEDAYFNHRRFTALKDSLFGDESQKQVKELQVKFETSQKEQEIEYLAQQEKQRRRERNISFFGFLLLAILGGALFYIGQQRKKAYQALSKEKQKSDQLLHELTTAQEHLIQSEKMASLGQLTAGVAHEINNPINFIMNSVEALKFDFKDLSPMFEQKITESQTSAIQDVDLPYLKTEMLNLINSIEKGAKRTQDIVSALNTFSHNTHTEKFTKANIHIGIDSALVILNHKIKQGVSIHKNYSELPLIQCNASRLNQVFLNILDNAIYAVAEQGNIHIRTYQVNENVVIEIQDDGPGMDEQTQTRVFEPFFTTKDVGEGTGLGLFISYGIIQQHKGQITCESSPDSGTCFQIQLPIK